VGKVLLVGGGVFHEPALDSLDITVTLEVEALLVVLGEEFKGGVATNGNAGNFVGGGVELGDDKVID